MKKMSFVAVATVALVVGCASPQDKASDAQRKVSQADLRIRQERLRLVDEYKKCLTEAGEDATKLDSCDRILKAIEALK